MTLREKHLIVSDTLIASLLVMFTLFIADRVFPEWSSFFYLNRSEFHNFFLVLAQIFATLLGFTMTTAAIIFSFNDNSAVRVLKKNPQYSEVLRALTSTAFILLIATLYSILMLFFYQELWAAPLVSHSIFFFSILISVKFWRSISLLSLVFEVSLKE